MRTISALIAAATASLFGFLFSLIELVHGGIFWTVMDFFFWQIAWIYWLFSHQVNMTIIKNAFSFFLT